VSEIAKLKFAQYHPANDYFLVEKYWCALLQECQHHYFLSWGWMSTWLKSLPPQHGVRLIVGFLGEEPTLAFFAGLTSKKWGELFRSRIVSLNATGAPLFDKIYLEYNTVLIRPGLTIDAEGLLHALDGFAWDEFYLPGLSAQFMERFDDLMNNRNQFNLVLEQQSAALYVDLKQVREAGMDYLHFLSSNKRSQIRRSIKEYEKGGKIEIQLAKTSQEALEYLDKLAVLHQKDWQERGIQGAFSNQYFLQFHRDLVSERFPHGEIQMLKISTPETVLGYLYNFIYNDRVYFYLGGLNYQFGNLYRPGLVSHYHAILYNAEAGMSIYDFMAGDADYKNSMATGSENVYWIRIFRIRSLFLIWAWMAALRERTKSIPLVSKTFKKFKNRFFSIED
jgi:hypothetical protein